MGRKKIDRTGETNINSYGLRMEIIKYNNADDMWVKFERGISVHTNWQAFEKGEVKSPFDKSIYEIGYIGEGNYKPSLNCKLTTIYVTWKDMLRRCYDIEQQEKQPTYKDCSVSEEWYNFQVFAKWYDDNFYQINGERVQLDKDILVKGNKVYSPSNCVFVPQSINNLFLKHDITRGNLPLGVSKKGKGKYAASCGIGKGKVKNIGTFDTIEEAFQAYKSYKEELIKQMAENYKDKIPKRLYNAMVKYQVEITD